MTDGLYEWVLHDIRQRIDPHDAPASIIMPSRELAEELAPRIEDPISVLSQDEAWAGKVHLHDKQTGQIATQINKGSINDWDNILDLRRMFDADAVLDRNRTTDLPMSEYLALSDGL